MQLCKCNQGGKKTLFILSLVYQEVPLRLKFFFLQGRPGLGSSYQENQICDLHYRRTLHVLKV